MTGACDQVFHRLRYQNLGVQAATDVNIERTDGLSNRAGATHRASDELLDAITDSIRPVLPRARDHFIRHANCQFAAGDNIAAIMDASPNARFSGSLAQRRKGFGVARK
jgi:hypothetical protein